MVTGVASGGVATIVAASGGRSGSAEITVTSAHVATVTVSPDTVSLGKSMTVLLTAIPRNAQGAPVNGTVFAWASSNSAVAMVSAYGLVTAMAQGDATVTATSEGKSGSAHVSVSCCEYSTPNTYTVDAAGSMNVHDDVHHRDITVLVRLPLDAPRPLPVIIFSPGGTVYPDGSLAGERWGNLLASAGFAVIHLNASDIEPNALCSEFHVPAAECEPADFNTEVSLGGTLPAIRVARARDASAVLDQLTLIANAFGVQFDPLHVAVAGWSGGAHTVMLLAGATVDISRSVKSVSMADTRFTAFLAASPMGIGRAGFTETSWALVGSPVMIETGSNDFAVIGPANRRQVFTQMPPGNKYEAYFVSPEASHSAFGMSLGDPLELFIGGTGLTFLDAYVRGMPAARTWLTTNQLARWSAGVGRVTAK